MIRSPGEGGTASLMSLCGARPGRGSQCRVCARGILPPGQVTVQWMDAHTALGGVHLRVHLRDCACDSVPGGGWHSVTDVAVRSAAGQGQSM